MRFYTASPYVSVDALSHYECLGRVLALLATMLHPFEKCTTCVIMDILCL